MPDDTPSHDDLPAGSAASVPPPIPAAPPTTPFGHQQIPTVPPTQPGELVLPPRRSVWPTPVGIIIIVLSTWTFITAFMAVATGAGGKILSSTGMVTPGADEERVMQALIEHGPFFIGAGILLAIAAGLGIGGGIGVLMRKRWGVRVIFIFAAWKLLASAVHATVETSWTMDLMQVSGQAGGAPVGMMSGVAMMMGGMKFAVGAVLPLFILIWFLMPHIKKEYRQW